MARVLKGSLTFICNRNEPYLHAFAFPDIASIHLPTLEGWKAVLAWVAGYVVRQFTCPKAYSSHYKPDSL